QRTLNKLDTLDPGNEDDWILKRVGGVELAYTDEQMRELKRRHGFAQAWGVESELIGPSRTTELWPSLDTSELVGALHTPTEIGRASCRERVETGAGALAAKKKRCSRRDATGNRTIHQETGSAQR